MPNPDLNRKWTWITAGLFFNAAGGLTATRADDHSAATKPATVEGAAADSLYKSEAGPYDVKTIDEDWRDDARKRDIPVRIYLPRRSETKNAGGAGGTVVGEKFPVIVFSHGLGASRSNYAYFGEHMASHGYIVIAPTHAGSDTRSIFDRGRNRGHGGAATQPSKRRDRGWLMESISDPDNLRSRPLDVSFIIDQLGKNQTLRGIADVSRIGVAGHSFGAYTAMTIGGMVVNLPDEKRHSFRDKRVKAVLPMSPEGTGAMGIDDGAWDHFAAPVLFLTGTHDYGAGARGASWRRMAFDAVHGVDDYLITLEDAGHMTFGNPGSLLGVGSKEQAALLKSLCTAFFDAYVKDDAKARAWLRAFATSKRADCKIEVKRGVGR